MDYRLTVFKTWSYRDRKRGMQDLVPDTYDVPEQVSHDVASRAIEQGVARRYFVQPPSVRPAPPQRQRKTRKTPAPKNKSLGAAPENKQTLV